jgi:transposase
VVAAGANEPEVEMIQVEQREQIRRAYFMEHKSIRAIAREMSHSRRTVREALHSAEPPNYTLKAPRPAPVLGPFKPAIDALLVENTRLPRKQRYTAHKIFEQLRSQGYAGSEVSVRHYVAERRRATRKREVYLPLEFDPGRDAQIDWGEADAILAGRQVTVQYFELRLNYSRKVFVRAYPVQRQEAFFDAHIAAFHYLGGVPHTLTYDNLTAAVRRVLEGRQREEQRAFVAFRSHYLFESRFCTPGQGHEKGGVESGIGYVRRNFFTPLPDVPDYEALNAHLLAACDREEARTVNRQLHTIGQAWALERPQLRPLPAHAFDCSLSVPVTLNPYSQVTFQTNRYSVPVEAAFRQLVLKAYPFHVEILHAERVVARHPRSYERQQEVCDPLHYLPLLEQRPGAFEHAKPLRQWRARWAPIYEQLLAHLQAERPDGDAIPEFVRILGLHRDHPATLIEQAVTQALDWGCGHLDGVRLCLHHLEHPETPIVPLDLSTRPHLAAIAQSPVNLRRYEALLGRA